MRKDFGNKKGVKFLDRIKGLYTEFRAQGKNLTAYLNALRRKGIYIFNIKTKSQNAIIFCVKLADEKKVFAITKELWYNNISLEKIKNKGLLFPLYKLFINYGFLLGACAFIFIYVYSGDFILGFKITGANNTVKRQVQDYLSENGVQKYSRFSQIDLSLLSDRILSSNGNLIFSEVQKHGNYLLVNLQEKQNSAKIKTGDGSRIVCDVDGIVKEIKVYRGTALFNVGDTVKCQDVLVDNYNLVEETKIDVFVVASVVVEYTLNFEYSCDTDLEEQFVLMLFEGENNNDYVCSSVQKYKENDKYLYKISFTYNKVYKSN